MPRCAHCTEESNTAVFSRWGARNVLMCLPCRAAVQQALHAYVDDMERISREETEEYVPVAKRKPYKKPQKPRFFNVGWHKARGKWHAWINDSSGKQISITGLYFTQEAAAAARDAYAVANGLTRDPAYVRIDPDRTSEALRVATEAREQQLFTIKQERVALGSAAGAVVKAIWDKKRSSADADC